MSVSILPDPELTLPTMETVRDACAKNLREVWKRQDHPYLFRIKSLWIIELIAEIEASGGVTANSVIKKLAEERLGYPPKREAEYSVEGDTLSILIYNAQNFRRSDELRARGFVLGDEAILLEAFATNRKLELPSGTLLTVRKLNGKPRAFLPRARTTYQEIGGYPVKLAAVEG